jgi:hypothetical protein
MLSSECVQNPALNAPGVISTVFAPNPAKDEFYTELGDVTAVTNLNVISPGPYAAPKRGRPRKPRYVCWSCGGYTRETRLYICQFCGMPRTPIGIKGAELITWWVRFVSAHCWTHFGTATFWFPMDANRERSRQAIQNYQRRYFQGLQRIYPGLAWFSVGEPDASGQLHIHFVCWAPTLTSKFISGLWVQKYEGFAKVGRYQPGASVYACKTLDRSDLHSIGGNWKAGKSLGLGF